MDQTELNHPSDFKPKKTAKPSIRFRLWRWYFLKFKLNAIATKAKQELDKEYQEYCHNQWDCGKRAYSFADWCADTDQYSPSPWQDDDTAAELPY